MNGSYEVIRDAVIKGKTWVENSFSWDNKLTPTEKNLYFNINSGCFGNSVDVFYSQETMAKSINRSVRTVQRSLKNLVKFGYITIIRRGLGKSNITGSVAKKARVLAEKVVEDIKGKKQLFKSNKDNKKAKYEKTVDTFNYTGGGRNYNFDVLEERLLYGYDKVKDLDGSLYDQVCIK